MAFAEGVGPYCFLRQHIEAGHDYYECIVILYMLTHFILNPQPTRATVLPGCLPILAGQKPAKIGKASDFPRSRKSSGIRGIADLKRSPWNDNKIFFF